MTECKNILSKYYELVRENTLRPDDKVAKEVHKMRKVVDKKCPAFGGKKTSKKSRKRRSTKNKKAKKTKKSRKVTKARK